MPIDPSRPRPIDPAQRTAEQIVDVQRGVERLSRTAGRPGLATFFPTYPFYDGSAEAGIPNGAAIATFTNSGGASSAIVVPASPFDRIIEATLRATIRADSANWSQLVSRIFIAPSNASAYVSDYYVASNSAAAYSGVDWRSVLNQVPIVLPANVGLTLAPQAYAPSPFGGAYSRSGAASAFYAKVIG